MYSIYFLGDPVLHEFRYVGQTSQDPEIRLRKHLSDSKQAKFSGLYVYRWINSLFRQGLQPQLSVIMEIETKEEANILEKYWIKKLREIGCPLTNLTDGGEGMVGYVTSEETRKKQSEARKGKPAWNKGLKGAQVAWNKGIPMSEEMKKRISESEKGKIIPEEARKKMSKAGKGRIFSEEHKRKISTALIGKPLSDERKRNISNALKGKPNKNKGKKRKKLDNKNLLP